MKVKELRIKLSRLQSKAHRIQSEISDLIRELDVKGLEEDE